MNKKLLKVLSLIIGFIMIVVVFDGCARGGGTPKKVEKETNITFWHGWSGAEEDTLKEAIDLFKKENPKITVEAVATPFDKLQDKLKAALEGGEGPDIFLGPHDWAGVFATLNKLAPVDSYLGTLKGDLLPSAYDAGKVNGKYYGIPESVETYVLIYNKDLVPNPPKTVDEMRKIAREQTKGGNYGLVFDMANFYFAHAYFAGYGGQVFKDDKATPGFDNPGVIDFLKTFNAIKNEDKVTIEDFNYNTMMDLMQTGKAAMIINGPWSFGDLDKAVAEGKGLKGWGAVKLPAIAEGKPARPFMGVKLFYIPEASQNKDAAAEFGRFMVSPAIQKLFNEKAGHVPANSKVELGDNWKSKIILEQAKDAIAMPNIPEMGKVWTPAGDMITNVLKKIKTPEEAAKEAQDRIVKDIKEMRGE